MKIAQFIFAFLVPLMTGACDRYGTNKCEQIKLSVMQSGRENDLVAMIDFVENDRVLKKQKKYPFGAGIYSAQNALIPEGLDLKDDAEVQIVEDSSGFLVGIQIIDSQANSIVVLKESSRWYAWPKDRISKVNEKIGVPCRIRD